MKKQIFTMVALACTSAGFAQSADRQVIGSGGNSFSDPTVSVDYTVGESVTATGVAGTFTVSQGFQQKTDNTSSIKETLSNASYRLYPNPAQDEVTLSVSCDGSFALQVSLCNAVGQTVFSDGKVEAVQRQYTRTIPLSALPSGIYFVNLYGSDHTLLQSIRFVKQ